MEGFLSTTFDICSIIFQLFFVLTENFLIFSSPSLGFSKHLCRIKVIFYEKDFARLCHENRFNALTRNLMNISGYFSSTGWSW